MDKKKVWNNCRPIPSPIHSSVRCHLQGDPSPMPCLKWLNLHPQHSHTLFYFFLCHITYHLQTYCAVSLFIMFIVHCFLHQNVCHRIRALCSLMYSKGRDCARHFIFLDDVFKMNEWKKEVKKGKRRREGGMKLVHCYGGLGRTANLLGSLGIPWFSSETVVMI